ncbi:hypothetical protein F5Y10DRAFT_283836 [Nemania abortiva]|nr:hypothetical protein F5Y10DRAFT_283836 [Nemania abortiva]
MADWGLVAAIVALLAYPLQVYAIPRFLKFIDQACGRFYRWIWPSGQQCTTLEWSDFSDGPYHGTKAEPMQSCCELSSNDPEKSTQLLFSGCWGKALSLLFPDPWRRAVDNQKVPKPYQLSSTTQYIRTDPAVLLLYTYFSTLCYDGASEFDDFVQLNESNGVLVARMCLAQRKRPSQGSYDAVCQRLCSSTGAQMRVILFEDAYIPGDNGKLIGGEDYWRGGGWVVAVGLSTKETIKGSALLRPILRADLVESSFRYKEDSQYMMLPRYVDTALEHVGIPWEFDQIPII